MSAKDNIGPDFDDYMDTLIWNTNYLMDTYLHLRVPSVSFTTKVMSSWRGALDTTLCDKVCQWLRFPPPIKLTTTI